MRFVYFTHSLRSDWNHGNAHFLRGVLQALRDRGHEVRIFEPEANWSSENLIRDRGPDALHAYRDAYPDLVGETFPSSPDLGPMLQGADVVLVHEWNEVELVAAIGRAKPPGAVLLFHDTHHRAASAPEEMERYDLSGYDGALLFGEVIRRAYLAHGWVKRAWTWHEAADPRVFRPHPEVTPERDLVWIGNWGDGERVAELHEFLIEPVRRLGLSGRIHGVRYPDEARHALDEAGIEYAGYLPNHRAAGAFAAARMTVHVPRRPYVRDLPGIPTIRMFEALACGIPLVSAPWNDAEHLFSVGADYLVAQDGAEMERHLGRLLSDPSERAALADRGRATVLARHTVAHRTDELFAILDSL